MRIPLVLFLGTLVLAGCKRETQEAVAQAKGAAADAERAAKDAAAQARNAADQAAASARSAADQARAAADEAAAKARAAADDAAARARGAAGAASDSARRGLDNASQTVHELGAGDQVQGGDRERGPDRAGRAAAGRGGTDAVDRRPDAVDPPRVRRGPGRLSHRLHRPRDVHREARTAAGDPGGGGRPLTLPVQPPVSPMLSKLVRELPPAGDVIYEPKWDGFRAIVFRDGDEVELGSRNEQPLTRYFPELVEPLQRRAARQRCVVDGEVVIAGAARPGLRRPAEAASTPRPRGCASSPRRPRRPSSPSTCWRSATRTCAASPLRRAAAPARAGARRARPPRPSHSGDRATAPWPRSGSDRFEGAGLDGVMVKPLDLPYLEDKREMLKVKHERTADCVVAGFRWFKGGGGVGSFLLGLYDDDGALHHVASAPASPRRRQAVRGRARSRCGKARSRPIPGRSGRRWPARAAADARARRAGGTTRRTSRGSRSGIERVVEVSYDHLQGIAFRHATHFLRWRPDRTPQSCTYAQLEAVVPAELKALFGA